MSGRDNWPWRDMPGPERPTWWRDDDMGDQVWKETGRLFAFVCAFVTLAALACVWMP